MRLPRRAEPVAGTAASPADVGAVARVKVRLLGVRPAVWRRVLVPSACTLRELHGAIQVAMGWEGIHLYQFCLRRGRYGSSDLSAASPDVTLAGLRLREGARFAYEYDLNVPWRHEVRVEGRTAPEAGKTYPACVGGAGNCPPEDCGGPRPFMAGRDAAHLPEAWDDLDAIAELVGRVAVDHGADPSEGEDALWRLEAAVERIEARARLRGREFSRRSVNARFRKGEHLDLMRQQR